MAVIYLRQELEEWCPCDRECMERVSKMLKGILEAYHNLNHNSIFLKLLKLCYLNTIILSTKDLTYFLFFTKYRAIICFMAESFYESGGHLSNGGFLLLT